MAVLSIAELGLAKLNEVNPQSERSAENKASASSTAQYCTALQSAAERSEYSAALPSAGNRYLWSGSRREKRGHVECAVASYLLTVS